MTALLIKIFVKNYTDTKSPEARNRYCNFGSGIGIAANVLLSTMKIIVGYLTASLSIVAY